MTTDDSRTLREEVAAGALPVEIATKYLNIYVGFLDWRQEIAKLFQRLRQDQNKTKQVICATILLPYKDHSIYIDKENPQNLLHKMPAFQQLPDKDWFVEFQKVVDQDARIDEWRRQTYSLGIVTPFEYSPITRQAYNWLYEKADQSGIIDTPETKQDVSDRFKNLVAAYGGACICNIFSRHPDALKRVLNWRTGYFFERAIYNTYTIEQICKIKRAELDSTNQKLVKPVRII